MVIESYIGVKESRKHPYKMIILAFIGTFSAIVISNYLSQGGLFMVFLIVLAILPLIIKNLTYEEKREEQAYFWEYLYSLNFIQRHRDIILDYLFIILGITLTISVVYLFLPPEELADEG